MNVSAITVGYRHRALGALVATAATALCAGILIVLFMAEAISSRHEELVDARRAIARFDAKANATADDALLRGERRLLTGRNASEAQAALQTALKDVAERHDATIESLQAMPGERSGGLQITRLKVTATVGEARVGAFYAAMIGHSPQLIPETIELRPEIGNSSNDPQKGDRRLAVRLDVKAFARLAGVGKDLR